MNAVNTKTSKLTFHENVKKTNGHLSQTRKFFPANEEEAELQIYRRSAPRHYPLPTYPFRKLKPRLAQHIADIHAKDFSDMKEIEQAVLALRLSPIDQQEILNRLKFLYGNNFPNTNENNLYRGGNKTRKHRKTKNRL
jgi:hypothetical protein